MQLAIRLSSLKQQVLMWNVVLFILFDVRTYLGGIIPMSVVSIAYFLVAFFTFLVYIRPCRTKINLRRLPVDDLFFLLTFLFLLFYGLRMFDNLVVEAQSVFIFHGIITYFIYLFFILVSIFVIWKLPGEAFDMKKILDISILLLAIVLLISLHDVLTQVSLGKFTTLRFRANAELDTLSYGHLGLSLMLLSFCRLKLSTRYWPFFMLTLLLGIITMVIANSRSPFFALAGILFIYFSSQKRKLYFILFLCLLFLTLLNIHALAEFCNKELGLTFFDRILIVLETGSDGYGGAGRSALFSYGMDMVADAPLLGSSFVLHEVPFGNGSYVHNIILEAFMTLGVGGGFLFILLNLWGVYCAYRIFRYRPVFTVFSLLYLQYLLFGFTSRSLISLPNYWYMLALVMTLYKYTQLSPANEEDSLSHHVLHSEK